MSITASEIVVYGSANMPDDDQSTEIGGSIDITTKLTFTDITGDGYIEVVSDDENDTMEVTMIGRHLNSVWTTEVQVLTGTAVVSFTNPFDRLCKFSVASSHNGTITVRKAGDAGDLMVLPVGLLCIRRPFLHAASDFEGGATREYHEKIFFKNENTVLALTNTNVRIASDPSTHVSFGLESELDGDDTNGTGNNRLVAPDGYSFGTTTTLIANNGNLTPLSAIGVWLKLTLAPEEEPLKFTLGLQMVGETV